MSTSAHTYIIAQGFPKLHYCHYGLVMIRLLGEIRREFFARTSAAGSAPPIEQHAESVTLANTAGHDADLLAHGISTSVKVARIDSAKAQAAAAAAMADAFARAAANAPLPNAL